MRDLPESRGHCLLLSKKKHLPSGAQSPSLPSPWSIVWKRNISSTKYSMTNIQTLFVNVISKTFSCCNVFAKSADRICRNSCTWTSFILDVWGQKGRYEMLLWFTVFQHYGDKWMEKRTHSKVKETLYFSSANMKLLIILNVRLSQLGTSPPQSKIKRNEN